MERSNVKLTVIFLLVVLNLFLLGSSLFQQAQSRSYENTTREQVMRYLDNRGVTVARSVVPWHSDLSIKRGELTKQLLPDQELPGGELPPHYEIQTARDAATLLMDFVQGLSDNGWSCRQIRAIQEGYQYSGEGERAVLTPMWQVETDGGDFLLNGAEGTLSRPSDQTEN